MPTQVLSELVKILKNDRKFWRELNNLEKSSLRASDLSKIKEFEKRGNLLLGDNIKLVNIWKGYIKNLSNRVKYGNRDKKNTITAMILAGAAIMMKDLNVRNDISKSIQIARQKFQSDLSREAEVNNDTRIRLVNNVFPVNEEENKIANKACGVYNEIIKTQNELFNQRIKDILTTKTRTLRLGYDLRHLDLTALKSADKEFFDDKVYDVPAVSRQGNTVKKIGKGIPKLQSPKKFKLYSKEFFCREENEVSNDEIYWLAFFTSTTNLEEVYNKIDDAVKNNSPLKLQVKSETKQWKSNGFTSCKLRPEPYNHNMDFGEFDLYQGFFPWSFYAICMEDDDHEYDAVSDVFDKVGDIAKKIEVGARIISVAAGPTVVGAGAAAVASVAETVAGVAYVCEAVVNIINYFDDDDTIGNISISGNGDYIGTSEQFSSDKEFPTSENNEGRYDLRVIQKFSGSEEVFRNWSCDIKREEGVEKTHRGILGFGNSGEDGTGGMLFEDKFEIVYDKGIYVTSGKQWSNIYWKTNPKLVPYLGMFKAVTGKIHWGVSYNHTIKYVPWVDAIKVYSPPL